MSNQKRATPTDEQLQIGSNYLVYHIRTYVETLLWIQKYQESINGWTLIQNAILETHLIHSRILIQFVSSIASRYSTDLLAIDYFHDTQNVFCPVQDEFLKEQEKNIGGQLVHLTTKPMPKLKSEQKWPIRDIAVRLIPPLKEFLNSVSENKCDKDIKFECLMYLAKINTSDILDSIAAST